MKRFDVRPRLAVACEQMLPTHEANAEDDHPEKPERVQACLAGLTAYGLWPWIEMVPLRSAVDEELFLVHPKGHIAGLKRAAAAASKGLVWLPKKALARIARDELMTKRGKLHDTFVTSSSLDAARCAAGGLMQLVDESLKGTFRQGLALCRPPGHHAGVQSSTGFCLINNVALAARYAMKQYPSLVKRVLIFDWDVHHGQGTQEIFWKDPNVLVVDMHLFAEGFYPSSGAPHEVGLGDGLGYTINVALPEGYTDACLLRACQEVLLPAARRFGPDLILVSAGFDASEWDPIGEAKCTAEGFGRITKVLRGMAEILCNGRLLLALEGGYDAAALASSIGSVATTLLDDGNPNFGLVEACQWHQDPLPASIKAIWATRMAHETLPLRLMDGASAALVPFRKRKREKSVNLNEGSLLGELLKSKLSLCGG